MDRLAQVHRVTIGSASPTLARALSDARDLALVRELGLDLLVELELVLLDLHLGVVRGLARLHVPRRLLLLPRDALLLDRLCPRLQGELRRALPPLDLRTRDRLLPVVLGLLQRARLLGLVGNERLGLEEPDEEVIARRRRPRWRHSPLRNGTAYWHCLLNGDLLRDGSPLRDDLLDDPLDHLLGHLLGHSLLHGLLRLGFRTAAAAKHGR